MESVDMEVKKLVVRIKYCMIFISLHTTVTCGLVSERVFFYLCNKISAYFKDQDWLCRNFCQ